MSLSIVGSTLQVAVTGGNASIGSYIRPSAIADASYRVVAIAQVEGPASTNFGLISVLYTDDGKSFFANSVTLIS